MSHSVRYRLAQGVLLLLAVCFGLQIFSPLRLSVDSIVLLSMAESAAHGNGFLDSGHKTVFPPGYSAALAVLLRAGLAHSWAIISLNLLLLAIGLCATYSVLIREFFTNETMVLILCSLFLLSFVVIRHYPIPLTDIPFFCCAMCCLAVISRAPKTEWNRRFVIHAVIAWILAVAAITVRRIGVALVPPVVFMVVSNPQLKVFLKTLSRRTKVILAVICVVAGVGTMVIVAKTSTLADFVVIANMSEFSVVRNCSYRLMELGEVFVNITMSKMPARLHVIVPFIGFGLFLLTLGGLAARRRDARPADVFLICYMGILFAWPYRDARFWLPVIPLLIAYAALSVKKIRVPRALVTMYCLVFVVIGFIAIAYSTQMSFAGAKFPDLYGDDLRPTYCEVFRSCPDGGDSKKVNPKVLRLLREFN